MKGVPRFSWHSSEKDDEPDLSQMAIIISVFQQAEDAAVESAVTISSFGNTLSFLPEEPVESLLQHIGQILGYNVSLLIHEIKEDNH